MSAGYRLQRVCFVPCVYTAMIIMWFAVCALILITWPITYILRGFTLSEWGEGFFTKVYDKPYSSMYYYCFRDYPPTRRT